MTLSGGQQQMLAVAQGLVRRPRLLMLDEPSAGLSPVLVDRVLAAAAQLRDAGTAVLLVEQLIEKALALADRVYALARGSIVLEARTNEADLPNRLEHAYFGAGCDRAARFVKLGARGLARTACPRDAPRRADAPEGEVLLALAWPRQAAAQIGCY